MSHPDTTGWHVPEGLGRRANRGGEKVRLGAKIREHAIQPRKNIKRFYKEVKDRQRKQSQS